MRYQVGYEKGMRMLCCARGSGDKLVARKEEKESNKLVDARETSWSHSGR